MKLYLKLSLVFMLLFSSSLHLQAQDVIIMRNGNEIQAQVEEVGQTEIKYKKFENLAGPTYAVSKSEVFMIRYKNGQKDVFEESKPATTQPAQTPVRINQPIPGASFNSSDIAKVRTSSTVGYIAIAPILGLAVGAGLADDGTVMGGVATVLFGVTYPVIAGSGAKFRDKSGVTGSPGLRLAGWIGYGLTMADAIIAVGLGASDVNVPAGTAIAIGVLGSASLAMIASDGMTAVRQGEELLGAKRISVSPTLGYFAAHQNKYVPTVGVKIRFN